MLVKPDESAANSSAAPPVSTACVNCGLSERRLLHHVRHRGIFRRLCTGCVLRFHPQSFCPTCFQVYPPHPPNDAVLTCVKCYSASHSHCVTTTYPMPYMCPLCANPNVPIFKLKTVEEANLEISDGEKYRVMDRDAAKKLLAAAKIAALSMNKAALAAKAEAERKAKEAALARKRAIEAMEHVEVLTVKEKRKKESASSNVSVSGVHSSLIKRENNVNTVNSGSRNGIVANGVAPNVVVNDGKMSNVVKEESNGASNVVKVEESNETLAASSGIVEDEKINGTRSVDRVENSNQVLAALNAVELRENEKMNGTGATSVELGVLVNDPVLDMDMDGREKMRLDSGVSVGASVVLRDNGSEIDHIMVSDIDIESVAENETLLNKQDVEDEVVVD